MKLDTSRLDGIGGSSPHINITITDGSNVEAAAPQWFTLADVMTMERRLNARDYFADLLTDRNEHLYGQKQAAITLRFVAVVACVYRKDIVNPLNPDDAGAVPVEAIRRFFRMQTLYPETHVDRRRIAAAMEILLAVGFMRKIRGGERGKGCAKFQLQNEAAFI